MRFDLFITPHHDTKVLDTYTEQDTYRIIIISLYDILIAVSVTQITMKSSIYLTYITCWHLYYLSILMLKFIFL